MNRKSFHIAMWLEWLVLPVVALRYWRVWDQLPSRLATHFNAAGQPNGWMPRETSLWFILGLLTVVLAVFTLVVYVAQRSGPKAIAWAMLGFSYFVVLFIAAANEAVLKYNLSGEPIQFSRYMLAIPIPIAVLILAILVSQRGSQLPAGKLIAEEVHGSPLWGSAFLMLGLFALAALVRVAEVAVRVPFAIVSLVFLVVGAAAWSGFHYCFTAQGLDIRALGFRLKSIPAQQVQRYAVDRWKAIGGYGIRGIGNCRAYVWGNKGVWITTASERVFLGHSEPERLVRDMDRMMKVARA